MKLFVMWSLFLSTQVSAGSFYEELATMYGGAEPAKLSTFRAKALWSGNCVNFNSPNELFDSAFLLYEVTALGITKRYATLYEHQPVFKPINLGAWVENAKKYRLPDAISDLFEQDGRIGMLFKVYTSMATRQGSYTFALTGGGELILHRFIEIGLSGNSQYCLFNEEYH